MNTTVHYLLKFGEKSNIKSLYEEGEIYMNTVQTFAELDKKEVGDKFERTVEIKNFGKGIMKLTSLGTGETHNFELITAQYKKDYLGNLGNIYCTYTLSDKQLKRKLLHRVDKRMLSFGTDCLVITDVIKFFKLVEDELQRLKIEYVHNLVNYRNFKKNSHTVTYFCKSHHFSYQHEHRFVVKNKTGLPLVLKIGSLKEISSVYSSEDIINKLKYDHY